MRRIFIILLASSLCLVLLVGGLALLAETYPLCPGSPAYGLQHAAEQWRLRLSATPERRGDFAVSLAERRLADLALAQDEQHILAAAQAFDGALDDALRLSASIEGSSLVQRIDSLLVQADIVLAAFSPFDDSDLLAGLIQKVAILKATENPQDRQALTEQRPSLPSLITAELISFLGQEVDHGAFPMNGGHAGLECIDCHADGEYADTPARCSYCHALPVVRLSAPAALDSGEAAPRTLYPNHFDGQCDDCHHASSWQPYAFDHVGVSECLSCHAHDLPQLAADPDLPMVIFVSSAPAASFGKSGRPDHYPGECAACHSDTADWSAAAFDHTGVRECYSCHEQETPASHYSGRCADCHNDFEDWSVADFNHAGHVDCLACHYDESPADHYAGQCSACHDTTRWEQAIFNHSGYDDCRSCHDRPVKHYPGQCSSCHDPATWEIILYTHRSGSDCSSCHTTPAAHYDANCDTCHSPSGWERTLFSHSVYDSCGSCHGSVTPPGHYTQQCSTCHSFYEWTNITFTHEGFDQCDTCHQPPDAHYPAACVSCHSPVTWSAISFDHAGFTDCASCHSGEAPAAHYLGQCSGCHNTTSWLEFTFDHTLYTDCIACHDAPYGHWPGQCSDCHNTLDWVEVTFDHVTYTNCNACHSRPAGHPRGQCSNCHSTDTWLITTTPTVLLPAAPAGEEERYVSPALPSDEEPDLRTAPEEDEPTLREAPAP